MPSSTPNYGWTYPISSDDLNAGATEIGNLANGIDTSLAAEASTRAAADSARPTSNRGALNVVYASVATDANGDINLGGVTIKTILKVWDPFGGPLPLKASAFTGNSFRITYNLSGNENIFASSVIALYYLET